MATSTPRKMGWINNLMEPKRTNRYELIFGADDSTDTLRLTCNSASIPSIEIEAVDVHRIHNKYRVAGSKVTYGDVNLKFYDYVDNSAAEAIHNWHKKVYNRDTGATMGYPKDYKKDLTLQLLDPAGEVCESWVFKGAWPKSITRPNNLDWSQGSGLIEVSMVLSIDEAILTLSTIK